MLIAVCSGRRQALAVTRWLGTFPLCVRSSAVYPFTYSQTKYSREWLIESNGEFICLSFWVRNWKSAANPFFLCIRRRNRHLADIWKRSTWRVTYRRTGDCVTEHKTLLKYRTKWRIDERISTETDSYVMANHSNDLTHCSRSFKQTAYNIVQYGILLIAFLDVHLGNIGKLGWLALSSYLKGKSSHILPVWQINYSA